MPATFNWSQIVTSSTFNLQGYNRTMLIFYRIL